MSFLPISPTMTSAHWSPSQEEYTPPDNISDNSEESVQEPPKVPVKNRKMEKNRLAAKRYREKVKSQRAAVDRENLRLKNEVTLLNSVIAGKDAEIAQLSQRVNDLFKQLQEEKALNQNLFLAPQSPFYMGNLDIQ